MSCIISTMNSKNQSRVQEEGHKEDRVAIIKVLLTVHIDYNETSIDYCVFVVFSIFLEVRNLEL